MAFAAPVVFQATLTPVALSAAIDTTEISYTVSLAGIGDSGINGSPPLVMKTGDVINVSAAQAQAAHVGIVGCRVIDGTHVGITWGNFTAAANVPATGLYQFHLNRL
jgi:hypothetical protein